MIKKNNLIFYFSLMSVSILLGFIIGRNINKYFIEFYLGKMEQIPVRYIILILTIYIDAVYSRKLRKKELIFRNKSILNLFLKNSVSMIFCFSIIFLFINIPILIMNLDVFFKYFFTILGVCIHSILISFIFTLLIKLIDVFTKKKSISCIIFVLIYIILDFYLDNFNFYFANEYIFTLNSIYTLPAFTNSIFVIFVEVISCLFLMSLFVNISIRKDYFAYEKNENNR